ncbi:tyrosine-type recombinase/integrase [Nonomuraea rubra]
MPTAEHGVGMRWQVRWRDDAGEQQKLNFETKPAAERKDAQIKASLDRGDYIDPKAGQITLSAYARQWRAGITGDPTTLERTDSRLAWICDKPIGDQGLAVLAKRPSLVQSWVKDMEAAGLQPSTIKGIVDVAGSVFDAALDDQLVGRNPVKAKSVKPPAIVRKKVVPWTLDRVEAVDGAMPARFAPMTVLGAGCGHRQGEMFGLALEDVDFLGREIHVARQVRLIEHQLVFSPPKGGKTRTVPLPETVGLRLSAHIAAFPPVEVTLPWVERGKPNAAPVTAALLFAGEDGKPLHRCCFNRHWHAALREADVPVCRENGMHALRHTAASAWLAASVDIRTVAEYLGHSDPGFTLRTYTHLMPDAADRARRAMDAFFARGTVDVSSALVVP